MNDGAFALSPPGTFPLSADPEFQDEVNRELQVLTDRVRTYVPAKCLAGLILTGSFARGEGTVLADTRARTRWLSDVECFVVLISGIVPVDEVVRALRLTEAELNSDPSHVARGIKVELSPIYSRTMPRLKPTIFTRELCTHGKLLWGNPAVIPMPQAQWADAAMRRDAFRLLNNRIIEQIAVRDQYAAETRDSIGGAYSLTKFWIDLGTSLSVFLGCYKPEYQSRQRPFEDALRRHPEILGDEVSARFLGHYRDALALKLGQKKLMPAVPLERFREAAEIARLAWNWESTQMLGGRQYAADWRSVFVRLSKLEPAAQRARDWGRLLRRPAALRSLGARGLLAAARAGSLATLIYGTGCVLDFFWDEIGSESGGGEIAAALCQVLNVRADAPAERRRMLTRATLEAFERHLRFAAA